MNTNTGDFNIGTMERPAKRPRLSFSPDSVEEVPEEWDLQTARAQNDMKLKSIFEGIFSKYGKDFTEVGDEIDLQTGKIVVNNGHLLGLREETDAGDESQPWLYEDEDADTDNGDNPGAEEPVKAHESVISNHRGDIQRESDLDSNDSLLDSALAYRDAGNTESPKQTTWKEIEDPGLKDPLWQAPELPKLFSTPPAESQPKVAVTPQLPRFTRESSPPGSGSLWTLPRRGRPPGRPRTDVKPKASPNKLRTRTERNYHSSPVAHDWSFSQIPDDDESDDPLQEYQPSPTPSRVSSVRGKRILGPLFTSNRYLESTRPPTQEAVPRDQSDTATDSGSDSDASEQDDTKNNVALDTPLQCHSSAQLQVQGVSKPEPRNKVPRRSYASITPDEGRLIIRLRHVQRKDFREIQDFLPNRKMVQIYHWDYNHWNRTRLNPPQLSAPWTQSELDVLEKIKDKKGLSWPGIKAGVPGRSRKEIEYELIRLWAGDEVWNNDEWDGNEGGDDESGHSSRPPKRPLDTGTPEVDPQSDSKTSRGFEMLIDDDSDSVKSENSGFSKLSAIDVNSPSYSRQGSRTPSRASPAKRLKLTTLWS